MNILINIICALSGAVFGAWFGHKFTVKLSRDKAIKQKQALYEEINIIHSNFLTWLKELISEFDTPLRESYSGPPSIYTQLIESLIVELSETDEIVSSEQRKLFIGLKSKNKALIDKDKKRDKFVNRWLLESETLDQADKYKTKQGIEFWTAHLLLEVIDIVFHTSQFVEENDNFMFRDYSIEQKIMIVCQYSCIGYDESFWSRVRRR
ncbi:hypothetical protein [Vibrio splendidus]|uniref:hypothetical protein n=1 Tax=Vibrio splendidus TaxID=29497 RepID=UPI00148B7ACC|nr:hypothetical protein [Vibrio splendidus]